MFSDPGSAPDLSYTLFPGPKDHSEESVCSFKARIQSKTSSLGQVLLTQHVVPNSPSISFSVRQGCRIQVQDPGPDHRTSVPSVLELPERCVFVMFRSVFASSSLCDPEWGLAGAAHSHTGRRGLVLLVCSSWHESHWGRWLVGAEGNPTWVHRLCQVSGDGSVPLGGVKSKSSYFNNNSTNQKVYAAIFGASLLVFDLLQELRCRYVTQKLDSHSSLPPSH